MSHIQAISFSVLTRIFGFFLVLFSIFAIFSGSTEAATTSFKGLHVSGNKILNESGQIVTFRGVNRLSGEWMCAQNRGIFEGPVDQASIDVMKTWNINSVRITLNDRCWLGVGVNPEHGGANYQKAVKDYVDLLTQNNFGVILTLQWTGPPGAPVQSMFPMPNAEYSIPFWQQVATQYKGNSHVVFDLLSEPYPDGNRDTLEAWNCLLNGRGACTNRLQTWDSTGAFTNHPFNAVGMQELLNTVRNTGAGNIVISPGVMFATRVTNWLEYKPNDPLNNLVSDWRIYEYTHNEHWCGDEACWDSQVGRILSSGIPVLAAEIGEMGCKTDIMLRVMRYLDSRSASGYLPWGWGPWNCTSTPALLSDWNGTPSGFGAGYKNYLAQSSPITESTAANIWGVDFSDHIYYKKGANDQWSQVPGLLKQISVGKNGVVWGVNVNDDIYMRNGIADGWRRIPGSLKQVDVGCNGEVWGVDKSNKIYYLSGSELKPVEGSLKHVSVGNGEVWGVNVNDEIFYRNGINGTWTNIPGSLKQVDVNCDGLVIGANVHNHIYYRHSLRTNWQGLQGSLKQVNAGVNGQIWGVNTLNQVYFKNTIDSPWVFIQGSQKYIAVDLGSGSEAKNYYGEYFDNTDLSGTPKFTGSDNTINFNWGAGSPSPVIANDNFSARWTGKQVFEEGNYEFTVTGDDGIRLFIDGENVLDKWIDQPATTYKINKSLTAGEHTLVLEYYERGGEATANLSFVKAVAPTPTPTATPDPDSYKAEYFDNPDLTGESKLINATSKIDFNWGVAGPGTPVPVDNFSARWTKDKIFESGNYQFTITGDDGVKVYIDDEVIIDGWKDQPATDYSVVKNITAGTHKIKVEYYEKGGEAVAKFSFAKTDKQATPTPAPTPSPAPGSELVVFGDALAPGFADWSWGSSVDFAITDPVYSGSKALSFIANSPWAGLRFHINNHLDSNSYKTLSFALKASQPDQKYVVRFYHNLEPIGQHLELANYGGGPVASGWKLYKIPISDFQIAGKTISDISIQSYKDSPQPQLFIDEFKLLK